MLRSVLAFAALALVVPNASDPTLKEFHDRVAQYVKLQHQVEAKLGPVPKTADPAAITRHEQALGEAIRTARADARQGDIFTPDVAATLRQLIAHDLSHRRYVERHAFIVSQPDVTLHVNDRYPSTVPLGTVPPRLLRTLPPLPDGLEYRFVNTALILRDRDANVVVDILPDAVPSKFGRP